VKKLIVVVVVLAALGVGGWYYYRGGSSDAAEAAAANGAAPAGGAAGGRGGRAGRGGATTMTVDSAVVARHEIAEYVTVVGNLIGEATVDVSPRVGGRIETILVKLGDRVSRGQVVAKMEDRDIKEQVNQATANLEVNKATVRARESDLKSAETTAQRQRKMQTTGLTSKQNLDDAEARYNAALAQVDVAKAQQLQTQARLDELKVTLSNTSIISPVDGFVGKRTLDPGAFAGTNTPVLSLVDISSVRLVANLVEKDFRRIQKGQQAAVEVDAFPGEKFTGQVSRVAPVFDAATRTAVMEIEVPNPGYRLKPGMYARVSLMIDRDPSALSVPRTAVVDIDGKRGVYVIEGENARFKQIRTGLQDTERYQVLDGVTEGQRVVTTGALAIKDGDRVVLVGAARGGRGGRGGQGGGQGGGERSSGGGQQPEGGGRRGGK
jgi:RND family efflux transporter MFP subunit